MSDDQAKSRLHEDIRTICKEQSMADYQAFPRWVCENILDLDNSATDEAVIDGARDYGIDIVHIDDADESNPCVYIGQVKFSETLNYIATENEVNSLIHAWKYLEDCPDNANEAFRQKAQEYKSIKQDNLNIQKIMLFVVAGSLDTSAKTLVERTSKSLFDDQHKDLQLQILDIAEIFLRIITPYTPPIRITFHGDLIKRDDPVTGKPSIVGYVNAKDLIKTIRPYKSLISLENPRDYIGDASATNKRIIETLQDEEKRQKFWKFNNGITAICNKIETSNSPEFELINFKIVNGKQTTSVLEKHIGEISDVFVSLTIHEAVDAAEHAQISEATNTQNPIKPIDMITNSPELRDLESECKLHFKEFFFERQTYGFKSHTDPNLKRRVTHRRVLKKNSTARTYYAYSKNPNDAMEPDKDFFSIANPKYYNAVFKKPLRDLIIPHIFMETLEELCVDWKKNSKNSQISETERKNYDRNAKIFGKRLIKYYVMYFIRLSMDTINSEKRTIIEDKMIEIMRNLRKEDKIPKILTNVLKITCNSFMFWFDTRASDTYPTDIVERMGDLGSSTYTPTPYEIVYKLKKCGNAILPILENCRMHMINIDEKDKIKIRLEEIA